MNKSLLVVALLSALYTAAPSSGSMRSAENGVSWEPSRIFGLGPVYSLSYSPDGTKLVISGLAGAQLWDVASWSVERQFLGHQGGVRSASWSPDQSQIATASDDQTIKIWDASTGALLNTLVGHTDKVYAVAWSSGGATLA